MEIIVINNIPRKIFVLITANMSNPFEIFFVNIWVIVKIVTTNIIIISMENKVAEDVIIKNQNDIPADTANDLNLVELVFILNRIDKRY